MNSYGEEPTHTCGSVNPKTMTHLVVGAQMIGKTEEKILEIWKPVYSLAVPLSSGLSLAQDRLKPRLPASLYAFFLEFCSSRKPPMNNRMAAMQMHESATLKAGHQPPLVGTSFS